MLFLYKIIEKSIFMELQNYVIKKLIPGIFQHGFKALHSTKIFFKCLIIFFMTTDTVNTMALVVLDLSSAFDIHGILVSCLEHCIGIRGTVLSYDLTCWIGYFLSDLWPLILGNFPHLWCSPGLNSQYRYYFQ